MLGAVEGGEEEKEECDDVVSVSSESVHGHSSQGYPMAKNLLLR